MKVYSSDHFVLPLPETHRFPMAKYRLLRERMEAHPGVTVLEAPAAGDAEILTSHSPAYLQTLKENRLERRQVLRLGFPYSPPVLERSRRSVGATLMACRSALLERVSANLAGGTHHAFYDEPEGYCVFNDAVIASRVLQGEGKVRKVLVIDCDVHQGNGTAALTADDPSIVTMSMHGEKNFPFRKEVSDYDIALPDGTGDEEYLEELDTFLRTHLNPIAPDLVIYLAGADPYSEDRLGRLSLTPDGLARRDRLVLSSCRTRGIPVALCMAGGYAPVVEEIVAIHERTLLIALEYHRGPEFA